MKTNTSSPYDNVCTIRIGLAHTSDNAEKLEGSTSGVLIDAKHGLVITHASILYQLVQKIRPGKLETLRKTGSVRGPFFDDRIEVEITLPNPDQDIDLSVNKNKTDLETHFIQPSLLNSSAQEIQPFSKYKGKMKMIFECHSLRRTIERTLPSDNWQFADDTNNGLAEKTEEKHSKNITNHEDISFYLLPSFILFKLKDFHPNKQFVSIRNSRYNRQGDAVEICATPFGGLSPEVFLNSRSRGIISNVAGPRGVLIMTDARCVPGSEGGALFYCADGQRQLTGVMIASLCWKNSEWVGLSLACAMSELLGSLQGYMLREDDQHITEATYTGNYGSSFARDLGRLLTYVHVGHTWGSAVCICPETGVYLTCSHVLNGMETLDVTVCDHSDQVERRCKVIYRTPKHAHFDLALIKPFHETDHVKLLGDTDHAKSKRLSVQFGTAEEGDVVYVVGHALFNSDQYLPPTVTRGIVSKLVKFNRIPVIMLTTCAVHAGASGGGVFNRHCQLVALAVCNSKDTVSGACYPHINMCVPMATIAPVVRKYLETNDQTILKSLHIQNRRVHQMWSIGTETATTTSHL